jgi:hypothetical protein
MHEATRLGAGLEGSSDLPARRTNDRRHEAESVEGFASKFRPLLMTQEVKLLHPAPWGPHP